MKRTVNILAGILLAALTVAAFARCWDYGLINLDDYKYVGQPFLFSWPSVASVKEMFLDVRESIWMPLTWMSYAIDTAIFGDWYGGFHLHSLLIHAANAVLVFVFLRQIGNFIFGGRGATRPTGGDFGYLIAALVWAIHPLRCESAVFVASRKDVLSFFWELLALIAWVKGSAECGVQSAKCGGKRVGYTVAAVLFFMIGAMCKPSVMTFPLLCLIVDFLIIRKVRFFRYVIPVGLMLFLAAFAAWQQGVGATGDFAGEPIIARITDACAAFGIYVRNTVWPLNLALQCMKRWPEPPMFLLPGVVISAAWSFYLLRKGYLIWRERQTSLAWTKVDTLPTQVEYRGAADPVFAGLLWFAVAVAPMLGIANFGYHAFADRFTYIPAVGLSIAAVAGLARLRKLAGQPTVAVVSLLAVAGLFAATFRQTGYWKNDQTMFAHTLEVDGDRNAMAHCALAAWYFDVPHDIEKCIAHLRRAEELDFSLVINNIVIYILALEEAGESSRIPEVMHHFQEMLNQKLGPEKAMRLLEGDEELIRKYGGSFAFYKAAKATWWLTDRSTSELAGDLLKGVESKGKLEDDAIWLYLKWKYCNQAGEKEKAAKIYEQLLRGETKPSPVMFRYLRAKR